MPSNDTLEPNKGEYGGGGGVVAVAHVVIVLSPGNYRSVPAVIKCYFFVWNKL
jgi:hypothetical protein